MRNFIEDNDDQNQDAFDDAIFSFNFVSGISLTVVDDELRKEMCLFIYETFKKELGNKLPGN